MSGKIKINDELKYETGIATGNLYRKVLPAALLVLLTLVVCVAVAQAQAPETILEHETWSGYESQPLRVNIWHDRGDTEIYRHKEPVRIHFEVNRESYVVVYRVDAEGEVSVLWPRSRFDDGFVFGNHTYNLPVPGAPRIRATDSDGVEYVQAVVSAYPFDLRSLEVDFHHEPADVEYAYYVAGDPFLAMNDVNFAITGLEDPEDYVATNYISYYVGRIVDHPRYLCGQCHDDTDSYRPYQDICAIEIHHDYGWSNSWYDEYDYLPVYQYPVYYYVDPWTMRPWINYWYRPWYAWPSRSVYGWDYEFYVWNHSPYWRGDVWASYQSGHRRYRPISKGVRYKTLAADARYHNPRGMVKSAQPTSQMSVAMSERRPLVSKATGGNVGVSRYKDTKSVGRRPESFVKTRNTDPIRTPGIRFDKPAIGGGSVRRPAGEIGKTGDVSTRPSPGVPAQNDGKMSVRPITPRNRGSQIWNGGRSTSPTERKIEPKTSPATSRDTKRINPIRSGKTPQKLTPAQPVKTPTVSKPKSTTKSTTRSKSSTSSGKTKSSTSSGKKKTTGKKR